MRQTLTALLFLLISGVSARAACPAVATDCGSIVVNNLTVGTSALFGIGTIETTAHQFQAAYNADPSLGPADTRQSMFQTTLTYAGNSTNIWENLNSFVTVNGPGIANGEINTIHSFLQTNVGANTAVAEGFESSTLNFGTTGTFTGYLGLFNNGIAGTASTVNGMTLYLNNLNATSGAVGQWAGINIGPMVGGGSVPTFYSAIRIPDAAGGIVTLGGIQIGALGNATPGKFLLIGADNSGSTFTFQATNTAGNGMLIANNGTVNFQEAGVTVNTTAVGPNLVVQGTTNSAANFAISVKNLAATNLFSIANNGAIAMAATGVSFNPTGVGPNLFVQGSNNSAGTFSLSIKNLAATNLLSIDNSGAITVGATAGVTCAGITAVTFTSANGIVTHC